MPLTWDNAADPPLPACMSHNRSLAWDVLGGVEAPLDVLFPEKGGALRTHHIGLSRHAIALVATATMVGLPLVLIGGEAAHAVGGGRPSVAVETTSPTASSTAHVRTLRHVQLADNRSIVKSAPAKKVAAPTTVPVTAPPTTVATRASSPSAAATSSAAVNAVQSVTTTTQAPATSSATGLATWYAWNPGQCASPVLPKGTWVSVRNDATGATTSCEVTDREADNPGRVIDLDTRVFAQIAPLSSGAVTVTISW